MRKLFILLIAVIVTSVSWGATEGDYRSKAAGPANWNTAASWEIYTSGAWTTASVVPTATNPVEIQSGHTITINSTTAVCGNLTVNGNLVYQTTPLSGLTVTGNIVVNTGGSFNAGTGTLFTHTLSLSGSLTADGTFDMNGTAGVTTTFTGATNNTISGTSGTIDFYAIVVNKGTATTNILEATSAFTMFAATSSVTQVLTLTNGTFKISSAVTITPYYGSKTICNSTARLWINNSSASVQCVGTGTNTGAGSPTVSGTLQIDAGTFGYGSGNNNLDMSGTLIMGGSNATLNMFGRITFGTSSIFTMTNGNINVDPQATSSLTGTNHMVQFSSTSATAVSFTGGTLTIIDPNASTGSGYALYISATTGTYNFAGSTIKFGDGTSDTEGSVDGFDVNTGTTFALGNVIVNNLSSSIKTKRFVSLTGNSKIGGTLTINSGTVNGFYLNGFTLNLGGNLTNAGTFNADGFSANTLYMSGTAQQTISGAGTFTNTNIRKLTIGNTSGASPAVDLQVSLSVSDALTLTNGTLGTTNSSVLTIGKSATSTTMAITRSAGSLSLTPSLATSGVTTWGNTYGNGTAVATITTGAELPSVITGTLTINNPTNGVVLNAALSADALTLTAGILTATGSNLLTITGSTAAKVSSGSATTFVNGPLVRTFPNNASAATYTFPIGKSAYNAFDLIPLTTGGTGTGTIKLEVFDAAPTGGTAGLGMATINSPNSKYWQLTNNLGTVTLTSASIRIYETGMTNGTHKIAKAANVGDAYDNIGGTVATTQITSFTQSAFSGFYVLGTAGSLAGGTYEVGTDQPVYKKLGDVANILNNTTLTGNVTFELNSTYNGTDETLPITFNQIAYSGASYWDVTIRPKSGVTGKAITGSNATAVLDIYGGDHITLDGRAGGSGTTVGGDLTIENTLTSSGSAAIRISNDASNNTVRYCTVKGNSSSGYCVYIAGYSPLNIGQVVERVEYCNITKGSGGNPNYGIYTSGASNTYPNSGYIEHNNVYDFASAGIYIYGSNSTWSVTYNKLYQTSTISTTPQYGISLGSGQTACVAIIDHNVIGGSAPDGSGTWTNSVASTIYPLYIQSHSTASSSTITNNKIKNFSQTATGASTLIGINITSTGLHGNVSGNRISNISQPNTTSTTSKLGGILNGGSTAGCSITLDTINDLSTSSRLTGDVTSTSAGSNTFTAYGIVSNNAAANQTISENTIYNIGASSTGAYNTGVVGIGIDALGSMGTVARNRIYGLTNTCTGTTQGIAGIRVYYGSWTYANNQISLTNGANTNFCRVFGVVDNGASNNWYFNSVYIGGSPNTGSAHSGAFADYYAGTRTVNLRNNIFYNERTGGTGKHYCIYMSSNPSTFTTNYNLFVPVADATLGYSGGADKTFVTWKALGGGTYDQNSVSDISSNVASSTLFTATSTGNLSIKTGYIPINNKADNTTGVSDDFKAAGSRGSAPDIGSDEFSLLATVATVTPLTTISTNGATLLGTVNANNESATGTFEYGLTNSYGSTAAWTPSPVTGTTTTDVSAAVAGLQPNTLYHYRINATTPKGTANGSDQTFTTTASASCTFIGGTSNDWADAINWDNGLPGDITDVTIPANKLAVVDPVGICKNLIIEPLGALTVTPGIAAWFQIKGNLLIESDASGTGSFIYENGVDITGNTNVQRYMSKDDYHYISSPVASQNISTEFINTSGGGTLPSDIDFYTWDETQVNSWINIKQADFTLNPVFETSFGVCKGYVYANSSSAVTKNFTGTLNSGDKTVTLTKSPLGQRGWNLVGNPFASTVAVNVGADATNNLLTLNASALNDNREAIYLWNQTTPNTATHTTNEYLAINQAMPATYLSPGQAFMVSASTNNVSFSLPQAARKHGSATFYKSGTADEVNRFWLTVEGPQNNFNETMIAMIPGTTNGMDAGYDAQKLKGNVNIALYTRLVDGSEGDYAIQSIDQLSGNFVVPVGLDANLTGNYTFKAGRMDNLEAVTVQLEDRNSGTFTTLSNGGEYSIAVGTTGAIYNRFFLHLKSTVGIDDPANQEASSIYSYGKQLYIQNPGKALLEVYSMTGQRVMASQINANGLYQASLSQPTGYYVVRLTTEATTSVQKIFIK